MGRDKALLPHPEGDTWLERTLLLLAKLEAPITLLSRHEQHLALAEALGGITTLREPPPWDGPLLALHRLMQHHPEEHLLLCPVDMPDLTLAALHSLLAAADAGPTAEGPSQLYLAHDSERLQPLLGLYASSVPVRSELAAAVQRGERRLQGWLATQMIKPVRLDPHAIRNVNRPEADQPAGSTRASAIRSQRTNSSSSNASSSCRDAGSGNGPSS